MIAQQLVERRLVARGGGVGRGLEARDRRIPLRQRLHVRREPGPALEAVLARASMSP